MTVKNSGPDSAAPMVGYSQTELDDIQSRWELRFPPDLISLMRERRSLLGWEVRPEIDWIRSPANKIKKLLNAPVEGVLWSAERNHVWWEEWGDRPLIEGERYEKLATILAQVPKLIPIAGRYLPETPFEAGNPVISIQGLDAIYYGAHLQDWIARESGGWSSKPWPPIKEINFWSEAVRKNSAL